jgi:hypothetical protein
MAENATGENITSSNNQTKSDQEEKELLLKTLSILFLI